MYSIPADTNPGIASFSPAMLDDLLPFSLPWIFRFYTLECNLRNCNNRNYFMLGNSTQYYTAKCYFTTTTPHILDLEAAYRYDLDTKTISQESKKKKYTNWIVENMKPISAGLKTALKDGTIQVLNKNMVVYKSILAKNTFFAIIIVTTALRQKIFSHFHARLNKGHMGEYKTHNRMRPCFF